MATGNERTHILVLNYNGRHLLRECLPSVLEAAVRAPVACGVTVVDNGSTDGSLEELADHWPGVGIVSEPNRGLVSFNHVLERMDERAVLLLNNDVKLDRHAVGPLLKALQNCQDALFSAPKCWSFDGLAYEGMRTRVRSRFGLVQGMCRVPGHESHVDEPDLTAAAGPVLMVDRARFLRLGGYDPLYFPGRIEDLDLGFLGWMSGWTGVYVPESVAYHRGFGSFGPAFGRAGLRSPGGAEQPALRLEEPGRPTASSLTSPGSPPAWRIPGAWPRGLRLGLLRGARTPRRRPPRPPHSVGGAGGLDRAPGGVLRSLPLVESAMSCVLSSDLSPVKS